MITDQDIENSRKHMQRLIQKDQVGGASRRFKRFFVGKAEQSLHTARALFKLSDSEEGKNLLELPGDYNGYLWAVNSAYYSMFYNATALLAHYGHRLKTRHSIHSHTYHALVYYFLDNDQKLTKHILEQYREAGKEASEILQTAEEEAREHVEEVKYERNKRHEFTYEMGKQAEKRKADTSIERAQKFQTLVKELMYPDQRER
ncbi:MAG: hypothetical protein SVV03_00755 [Candidatus Nanohaloarchaea archaeon]|nr:hypothetical protein [Candidatus Nanohaloarchaea archaeon]